MKKYFSTLTFLFLFLIPFFSWAADRYWVGGTDDWNATAGTKWATTSGGAGGEAVPTSSDDVYFDAASGTVTVTITGATATCANLIAVGFTGTLTGTSSMTVSGTVFTLDAGMAGYTRTGTTTFNSTSGTTLITTAGFTLDHSVTFNGAGGTFRLEDNMSVATTRTTTLTAGTFNANGFDFSTGRFSSSGSGVRSTVLGSGQWTVIDNNATVWNTGTVTNLTIDRTGANPINFNYSGSTGTRTITAGQTGGEAFTFDFNITAGTDIVSMTNARNVDFTGFSGSLAASTRSIYGNLTLSSGMTVTSGSNNTTFSGTTGTSTITTNGTAMPISFVFNHPGKTYQLADNLTSADTRILTLTQGTLDLNEKTVSVGIFSSSGSNARVLDITNATINLTNASGATTVWDTTDQTNLTITGASTGVVNLTGANSSTRTIIMDNNPVVDGPSITISGGSGMISLTNVICHNYTQTSGYTGAMGTGAITIKGSFTLHANNDDPNPSSNLISLAATTTGHTINTGGLTVDRPITMNGVGGGWTLASDITLGSSRTLTMGAGTFDAATFNINGYGFASSNSLTRVIDMGSGTHTLSGTTNAWNFQGATEGSITFDSGTSTIVLTNANAEFQGGGIGLVYNDVDFTATGAGTRVLQGISTFNEVSFASPTAAYTVNMGTGAAHTITTLNLSGVSGSIITVGSSAPGTRYTLTKSGGGAFSSDYVKITDAISNPIHSFKAGSHSSSGGNNSGVDFYFEPNII